MKRNRVRHNIRSLELNQTLSSISECNGKREPKVSKTKKGKIKSNENNQNKQKKES